MKRMLFFSIGLFFLANCLHAQEIFATEGKAIRGYDPVAFFTKAAPVKGADSLALDWKGVSWLFSSKENLEAFKTAPEKYAPQYGGYCAYGTAGGHKSPTQTDTWTILNDKLYFNYNLKVKELWSKDRENLILKADKNWPELKDKKP